MAEGDSADLLARAAAEQRVALVEAGERAAMRAEMAELRLAVQAGGLETATLREQIIPKLDSLLDEVVGTAEREGLRGVVRRHDVMVKRLGRLFMAMATAVAGALGLFLWETIKG